MRSFTAIRNNMCTRKVAIDYTAPMPERYLDAARGNDMYLCPFCGFAHFTKYGHSKRQMKRTRNLISKHFRQEAQ